jgi:hypothetical protein
MFPSSSHLHVDFIIKLLHEKWTPDYRSLALPLIYSSKHKNQEQTMKSSNSVNSITELLSQSQRRYVDPFCSVTEKCWLVGRRQWIWHPTYLEVFEGELYSSRKGYWLGMCSILFVTHYPSYPGLLIPLMTWSSAIWKRGTSGDCWLVELLQVPHQEWRDQVVPRPNYFCCESPDTDQVCDELMGRATSKPPFSFKSN